MKAEVTKCGRFIQITKATDQEFKQMQYSFKRRTSNWKWHPLVKKGVWDGYIKFMDKFNRIPIGLWGKLNSITEKHNIKLDFTGIDKIINQEFSADEFEDWVWDFYRDTIYGKGGEKELRPYQIKSCIDTIKYFKSRSELATSAGKTIIMFTIFAYLFEMGYAKKHLIIVPNTSLIIQTYEGFLEYAEGTRLENVKIQMIGGGRSKEKKDVDIVIGTYQTLKNLNKEFYDDITCVAVDECHHTTAKSIKEIITKSYDSKYRYGLSGTLKDDDSAESFTLDAYLGPIVNKVTSKFLIDNNYATKIKVKSIILDYMPEDSRKKLMDLRKKKGKNDNLDGTQLLDLEKKLVIENDVRFRYIADMIGKTTKNSLVLFLDIKHGYGKKYYHYLREHSDKTIFYVDGDTKTEVREEYKRAMETGDNKILVASFGTFAQGISINNLHHIFFVESYKSDRLIRQSLGRGMRLLEGKKVVYIWDFVDDFRVKDLRNAFTWIKNNYLYRHGQERIKTYKEQGFPYKKYKVKL